MLKGLRKILKNRKKIFEGIFRTIFPNDYIKKVAKARSEICRSNVCGLYDAKGTSENCFIKGQPCCSGCGCNELFKTHSLSSYCYLKDLGKTPLWEAVMSQQEEDVFRNKLN